MPWLLLSNGGEVWRGEAPSKIIIPLSFEGEDTIRRVKERRSLSYITNSPSPYQGEGDKGDRVEK